MQLAPMIDIVFLLLIFFIVTWQYTQEEQDLRVSVPTSEEGSDPKRVLNEIIVNVRPDGTVIVWGENKTKSELKETLTVLATTNPKQPIRVRGDADTPFQKIVEVIDVCSKAGIWNISFATQSVRDSE